jgi:ABC-type Fe3+ transport system substrate-binding protein
MSKRHPSDANDFPITAVDARRRALLRTAAFSGFAAAVANLGFRPMPAFAQDAGKPELIAITPDLVRAAQKEGEVFLRYSSPETLYPPVAAAFKAKYGINVITDRKVGPVGHQVFAQEERAGRHVMDVVETGDPMGLLVLDREGLYLHYTLEDLDAKLSPEFRLKNVGYGPLLVSMLVAYNPDVISHRDAKRLFKTWAGANDPSLKGALGISSPKTVALSFALNLMLYQNPKYGIEYLKSLGRQGVRVYRGSAQGREDLAAGAIKVFLSGWESAEMETFERGTKVAWTYPEQEPVYVNLFISISKKAPHPNAARLFAAWLFTPEGADAYAKSQSRTSVKGIPDTRSAVAKLKQTDWWQPYPTDIGWSPDMDYWAANFTKLSSEFEAALAGK